MKKWAYYNERDPFAAAWIRELMKAGHIMRGEVDERSIEDVLPSDAAGFLRCHWFAGVAGWDYALRQAGWPDDRPVWTGSCPCQPFSAAGKGAGMSDERHLWPAFFHLITQCQPDTIFGEQVASPDGLGWLDLVQADLEGAGYATGAVDLCAAGVGAPHIRQRLWFVADRMADTELYGHVATKNGGSVGPEQVERRLLEPTGACDANRLADARLPQRESQPDGRPPSVLRAPVRPTEQRNVPCHMGTTPRMSPPSRPTNGFWRDADWLGCRDGKWRPVEPGTFPLAHGAAARVGRLRGYGNAINAEAAKAFIGSYLT